MESATPGLLAYLRRSGIVFRPASAGAAGLVKPLRAFCAEHRVEWSAAERAIAPAVPVVIAERGSLRHSEAMIAGLVDRFSVRDLPPAVIVSDSLDAGLAELGWRRSTYRVGFARADNVVEDVFAAILDRLGPDPRLPPYLARTTTDVVVEVPRDLRVDVDAWARRLSVTCAWASPQTARVGDGIAVRVTLPDGETAGTATLRFDDDDGTRLSIRVDAGLPSAPAFFHAQPEPRGLRALFVRGVDQQVALPAFDRAHLVRGNLDGINEAAVVLGNAAVPSPLAALHFVTLAWSADSFNVELAHIDNRDAEDALSALLAAWERLVRARRGLALQ